MTSAILAVDVGATNVRLGLADLSGQLLPDFSTRFATPDEPASVVDRIADWLERTGASTVRLVSCAAPGPLDSTAGILANMHNRGWADVPLTRMLTERLAVPARLEDDATAAAVAEAVLGAGAGCDPVGYITVSTGVGAGIVIRGQPYRGAHGLAGEIGHLVIDPDGPLCGCGRRGDIESYAGGLAISRRAAGSWPPDAERGDTLASTADVFTRASKGDRHAIRLVDEAARALARAIAVLAAVADPERIVLGGSIALAHPDWVRTITADARHLCMAETGRALDVRTAALGDESALAGAALLGASA